jgi:beta-phosphoglucomutase
MEHRRHEGHEGEWHLDRFQAFLFDMDGVITDSMPYHYEAWRRIFEGFGISVSREEILKREGEQGLVTLETILSREDRKLPPEVKKKALEDKEAVFRSLARPTLFPGAETIVKDLRARGKRLALVTGTSRQEAETNLPPSLISCFDVLISGDMVTQGKPHPEPYRTALQRLDASAEDSLVIENAPYGIQSAKGAGLRCIAVTTSLPAEYLREADQTVQDLEELRSLLFGTHTQGS